MTVDGAEGRSRITLRKNAERRVSESIQPLKSIPRDNILELIHELEVHQVELEQQNQELRRSQSELEGLRKKYFDLYDLAPIGYVTLDQKGLIREINLIGAALLGTERRRLNGRRFARFVAQPESEGFHRFHRRLFEFGKFEDCELKLVRAERAPVDVLLAGIAVRDIEGSLNLCQIAVTDITLRKRAEERERLAVIGETAARFAHEIANPLNGIAYNLRFLEKSLFEIGDEKVTSTMKLLVEEIRRLNDLLRDFSKLSKRETYDLHPTSLAVLAKEILDGEEAKYNSKGIRVKLIVAPDLPLVLADRGKIKQAMLNLCKNAEEAMPEGGTLTIIGAESKDQVIVEVRDTGVGIPEGLNLAEPFTTTKSSGSGLGIMIVRQIISLHHGSFSYNSEPGKGSSFFLRLPVHSAR